MSKMTVAIVEDDKDVVEQIEDHCSEVGKELGIKIERIHFGSIDEFEDGIKKSLPDLMIVDLCLDESNMTNRSGWETIERVLSFEIIPVIVYSAFAAEQPRAVFRNLFIVMVQKGGGKFEQALKYLIQLKLEFNQEKERIISEFGKLSLGTLRNIFGEGEEGEVENLDPRTLAVMAVGRLVSYLLNVPSGDEGRFPPESMFIYPPLKIDPYPEGCLFLGDFLEKKKDDGPDTLWLVISPSCDLVFDESIPPDDKDRTPKVEEVLLLRCYSNWEDVPFLKDISGENDRRTELNNRSKRGTIRVMKCPSQIFGTDHIVISSKGYQTICYSEIRNGLENDYWKKLVTLATPHAESIQSFFMRDISRIGTPDVDVRESDLIKEFVE